ncbi:unnamed protein product [Camellia sinensis]
MDAEIGRVMIVLAEIPRNFSLTISDRDLVHTYLISFVNGIDVVVSIYGKQVARVVDIASPYLADDDEKEEEEEEEPNDGVEANSAAELVRTMSDCLGIGKMELRLEIILKEMLYLNPAKRISTLDAVAHAYFKNDDDDEEKDKDNVGDDVDDDDP